MFKQNLKSIFKVGTAAVVVTVPFLVLIALFPAALSRCFQFMADHVWAWRAMRWCLLVLFILCWERWLRLLCHLHLLPFSTYEHWKDKQLYIACWSVLFELLVVENIVGKLLDAVMS